MARIVGWSALILWTILTLPRHFGSALWTTSDTGRRGPSLRGVTGSWRLRGYAVERLLGRGASSEVWRARAHGSGDAVALKRLFIADAEQARRAHAEAALLSVLDHPNLVRLHALVPSDDAAVLVLDLADGGSLAELLATRGRLTPGEVITALAPIAAALAYLTDRGWCTATSVRRTSCSRRGEPRCSPTSASPG